jgi:hypothetical protein
MVVSLVRSSQTLVHSRLQPTVPDWGHIYIYGLRFMLCFKLFTRAGNGVLGAYSLQLVGPIVFEARAPHCRPSRLSAESKTPLPMPVPLNKCKMDTAGYCYHSSDR